MKVRRQHAWGAFLIVLFTLPVLCPDGVPALERPIGSFFGWFSRVPALNPQRWDVPGTGTAEHVSREQAQSLREENAQWRELLVQEVQQREDLRLLREAFGDALQHGGLDRLPRVLASRVLRTSDPSGFRRSILIDRGAEDGVVVGAAVVSGNVYLGRVEVLRARSALVKLVTDRRSRLEVALRTDKGVRLRGYVRGAGRGNEDGTLDVRFLVVPDDAGRVLPRTAVFTSNADPRVRAELLVGWVKRVDDRDLDGIPVVELAPALDLSRSTRVLVLLPNPD